MEFEESKTRSEEGILRSLRTCVQKHVARSVLQSFFQWEFIFVRHYVRMWWWRRALAIFFHFGTIMRRTLKWCTQTHGQQQQQQQQQGCKRENGPPEHQSIAGLWGTSYQKEGTTTTLHLPLLWRRLHPCTSPLPPHPCGGAPEVARASSPRTSSPKSQNRVQHHRVSHPPGHNAQPIQSCLPCTSTSTSG